MKNELSDKSLCGLLQDWKVSAEPAPRFSAGVWRRIAEREAHALAASWYFRWKQWLTGFNKNTDLAWGAVAALVVVAGAGWIGMQSPDDSLLAATSADSYLTSVDPYRMNH